MADPKYHSDTWQENEDTTVDAKRVKGYLWDPDNMVYVKQIGSADGIPVTNNVLSQYVQSDVDGDNPRYVGFVRSDGGYYILKSERTDDLITYRYHKGSSGYAAAWADRINKTYNYFDVEF